MLTEGDKVCFPAPAIFSSDLTPGGLTGSYGLWYILTHIYKCPKRYLHIQVTLYGLNILYFEIYIYVYIYVHIYIGTCNNKSEKKRSWI